MLIESTPGGASSGMSSCSLHWQPRLQRLDTRIPPVSPTPAASHPPASLAPAQRVSANKAPSQLDMTCHRQAEISDADVLNAELCSRICFGGIHHASSPLRSRILLGRCRCACSPGSILYRYNQQHRRSWCKHAGSERLACVSVVRAKRKVRREI